MGIEPPPAAAVEAIVRTALAEDRACEDVTTAAVVEGGLRALGRLLTREEGVVCGLGIVDRVFAALDPSVVLTPSFATAIASPPEALSGRWTDPPPRSSAANGRR